MKQVNTHYCNVDFKNNEKTQQQNTYKENISVKSITNARKIVIYSKPRFISESQASHIITKTIREKIANKSYSHMFSDSSFWKQKIDNPKGFLTMKKLSSDNIRQLTVELGVLDDQEIEFLDEILQMKFSATHATDASVIDNRNMLTLFSRSKLEQRNIDFPLDHSTSADIDELGNDDFIFFAVEPGLGGYKCESRFGKTVYIVDFDHPSFSQVAWVSLQEQLLNFTQNTRKRIANISEDAHKVLSENIIDIKTNMFLARDFRKGLGLSLIKQFRKIPSDDRHKLLSVKSTEQFNDIINGLYRPEVKVPRHLFVNHSSCNVKVSCGAGGALSISDFDNDEVISSAVSNSYRALYFASERLKTDINIVEKALKNEPKAASFIHDQLEKDLSFAKKVIDISPDALKYFPKSLTDNDDVIQYAVKKDSNVLQFASDRLRDNESIVLSVLDRDITALKFASERLQKKFINNLSRK
ncbi:TPA: DUF4116 domain-containing protein [Vibrio parahaemolyticus]|uniref:DUF4116 domain-containing protein n=1 Tax=Vibrio parahaemolyticus TaxID=670 RepID=UPI00097590C7|nr:DUF4116 domain-containing protein [Vibrio parahaemolyticus]EJE4701603.1 DUF4116 domain-containing protein [Vibrio parahaemolyticus]ELA9555390.1 DUF4116 domain-containing protein [Vibrio parahaemolyticus]OMP47828.1 hypothetical protein BBM19_22815 [Vibrio parahaemolyticus]TXM30273.1 DUF4116 domain-containing protein [Vibrio parahaemolyticus]